MRPDYFLASTGNIPYKGMMSSTNPESQAPEPHGLMPVKDFLKMRDKWIDYINRRQQLSHATARVGTFIALRMSAKNQKSNWSVDKISKQLGCSTKTVTVAIEQMQRDHALVVYRPNRRANQIYYIRLPYSNE